MTRGVQLAFSETLDSNAMAFYQSMRDLESMRLKRLFVIALIDQICVV